MSYRKEEVFYMKEMEWGVNSLTNTTYMNYEFDIDSLYSTIVKLDYLVRVNPNTPINLNIASYGGDVYAMMGLVDYINGLSVKVNTHCVGTCMSAASVLLACGTGKITISPHGTVMVHEGSAFEAGKTSDVLKGADHLKKLQSNINRIMGDVTNKSTEFWEGVSKSDTYLTAEECLEYGIVDEIIS